MEKPMELKSKCKYFTVWQNSKTTQKIIGKDISYSLNTPSGYYNFKHSHTEHGGFQYNRRNTIRPKTRDWSPDSNNE